MLATIAWVIIMFETAGKVTFVGASWGDLIIAVALLDNLM